MKKILTFILFFIANIAIAAPNWKLATVTGKDLPVGYIYYTDAMGILSGPTQKKSFTSLRFICSLKGGDPILGIVWDGGIYSNSDLLVSVSTDATNIQPTFWINETDIIYKPMIEIGDIIKLFKTSKYIKFQWVSSDTTVYTTTFNVSGFDLTNFNTKCKLQL